jgi:hypothetical protein
MRYVEGYGEHLRPEGILLRKSVDELIALDDEAFSGNLMAPPVLEQRDERHNQLSAILPELRRKLYRKHVTRRVLWEEYRAAQPYGCVYSEPY